MSQECIVLRHYFQIVFVRWQMQTSFKCIILERIDTQWKPTNCSCNIVRPRIHRIYSRTLAANSDAFVRKQAEALLQMLTCIRNSKRLSRSDLILQNDRDCHVAFFKTTNNSRLSKMPNMQRLFHDPVHESFMELAFYLITKGKPFWYKILWTYMLLISH